MTVGHFAWLNRNDFGVELNGRELIRIRICIAFIYIHCNVVVLGERMCRGERQQHRGRLSEIIASSSAA